ncbi:kinase-like domain protein [Diplogelasinospora grovesii]|uniref:Kinase-like domain protein n=1 Tax=Diplogelasinospora grovesii TaxID=303347 RepID=A0AAN6NGP3_9PEZI|nr:kinase-like domain protein [Diplogelasinospora grovesii]
MLRNAISFRPVHSSRLKNVTTAEIIEDNPIKKGLNAFRTSFSLIYEDKSVSYTLNALNQLGHKVYNAVPQSTPPPRPIASSYFDGVLKEELGLMYAKLPDFYERVFGGVVSLKTAFKAIFKKCKEGSNPLYYKGWSKWPRDVKTLAQPDKSINSLIAKHKINVSFTTIIVVAECKVGFLLKAWLNLRRYVKEFNLNKNKLRFIFIILGLVINELIRRALYIAGRQYTERVEEGEMLREATDKEVANIARYYHHETGLNVTTVENYRLRLGASRKGRNSMVSRKRSPSPTNAPLPPSKRSYSVSLTKAGSNPLLNRVHKRVILRDYGKLIYKASSLSALLTALEGYIGGHESLYEAGFLYKNILINNLIINEDDKQRDSASGVKGKISTRAFIVIGALISEQHSFMHDLESFFWNYKDDNELVAFKKGEIANEEDFLKKADKNFTSHYRPLIPWVNRLRRKVFLNGGRWKMLELKLYSSIKKILREARKDLKVLADR